MVHVFKNSLMIAALVSAFTVTQTGNATAQIVIESATDIPVEPAGSAQAYFEAATGNVFISIGTDILIVGVTNVDTDLFVLDNLPADADATPFPVIDQTKVLPFPFGPEGGLDSGIFFLGTIFAADPSITDIASFQASPIGTVQLQFFETGGTEGLNDFNLIAPAAAVPEPNSLSILALAGIAALARRRR